MITNVNTKAGPDLVLPLSGHNLSVDTSNLNSSVKTSTIVGFNKRATESLICSSTTIIGSLGSRETTLRPSEGCVVKSKECVLLLNAKPGLELLCLLEDGKSGSSCVGGEGSAIGLVAEWDQKMIEITNKWKGKVKWIKNMKVRCAKVWKILKEE